MPFDAMRLHWTAWPDELVAATAAPPNEVIERPRIVLPSLPLPRTKPSGDAPALDPSTVTGSAVVVHAVVGPPGWLSPSMTIAFVIVGSGDFSMIVIGCVNVTASGCPPVEFAARIASRSVQSPGAKAQPSGAWSSVPVLTLNGADVCSGAWTLTVGDAASAVRVPAGVERCAAVQVRFSTVAGAVALA